MHDAVYDILPRLYAALASFSHLIKPTNAFRPPFHPVPCPEHQIPPLKIHTALVVGQTPKSIRPPYHRQPRSSVSLLVLTERAALISSLNKDLPCLVPNRHYEKRRMPQQHLQFDPQLELQSYPKA